jgi:hypothetical protein
MLKQPILQLEKALKNVLHYPSGLEPITPTFALHSSTTEQQSLCLGDKAEVRHN